MAHELTRNDVDALRHSLGFHNTGVWVGRDAFESLVDAWDQNDRAQRGVNQELKDVEEKLVTAKEKLGEIKNSVGLLKSAAQDLAKAIDSIEKLGVKK